jgi:hypothetical protein
MNTSILRIGLVATLVVIVGLLAAGALSARADEQGPLPVRIVHGWGHMMTGWGMMGGRWDATSPVSGTRQFGPGRCCGGGMMGRGPWGSNGNGAVATGE